MPACDSCGSVLGAVQLTECKHILCRPCHLSSHICLVATCRSLCQLAEPLELEETAGLVLCRRCDTYLQPFETGVSLPCPHSVWLCTNPLPTDLAGSPMLFPGAKVTHKCATFRTPRPINGSDTHCDVASDTRLLWNPDISLEIVSERRIRVVHCMRNLRVRFNHGLHTIFRGSFNVDFFVSEQLTALTIFAPQTAIFKPGPCRLLLEAGAAPEILTTDSFQYFTPPMLNPVLGGCEDRGLLLGANAATSGMQLRDLLVAQNAVQCTRCRRVWPINTEFDDMRGMIDSCGVPGLLCGHLQAVMLAALAIPDYTIPEATNAESTLSLCHVWPDLREANKIVARWRALPVGGLAALELPGVVLAVGHAGLLDAFSADTYDYPLLDIDSLQCLLINMRIADDWQRIPHDRIVHYRHLPTGHDLYATTTNNLIFFHRTPDQLLKL